MASIKQQIESWATSENLELVCNGWLNDTCDNIDFEKYGVNSKIKVKKTKKFVYIYLPTPTNTPYKHRFQIHVENGRAYIWRYLFK